MITLKNVVKKYGNKEVLKDINVEFPDGKTTVILGPSGSGKSTLLRSLDLLVRPESGTLNFGDLKLDYSQPVSKKLSFDVRKKTSMVFQNWNLFPNLTVLQNITTAPETVLGKSKKETQERAKKLLEQVGLSEYADRYPSQLSGGQQQRISICRALAMDPEYILLDEPTSALDPELETQVLLILEELSKMGQSMIIVTHNMEFARSVADKIVFVEDGNILFDDTPDQFFNHPTTRIKDFLSGITFNDKSLQN
ncbi:amino acid ABC transporter ATP-binding protein [Companilactobacillus alimentarius]|uniref:Arginine ABC transporter ATP-binding protein ArtP n=1 Tax=Companilactobacillus alimentarius DSM 20249 TaxID=1423720 RepID=A0A2K9HGJ6_9LACO|nr:amino acid ABC transporter ATP-binding protein [Companilactobacillus alimentarius]AUI71674.1 arginine ABC transporter ATP-binding protein ArtP [Companilactobacillus alimentarius DSM 20249]KRK78312.1 amino acid ABC transporter ATP-binding component [Companilactobacillus alimentarius DSM 20249]MDT6953334.1 amino acid ABC transporter ATP-binding protein [Companilactobacillus alimentarius]GEO44584.1 arginine ABC transporter ATP-binding protein ArtP [Companilactobacillus alimentarius]